MSTNIAGAIKKELKYMNSSLYEKLKEQQTRPYVNAAINHNYIRRGLVIFLIILLFIPFQMLEPPSL